MSLWDAFLTKPAPRAPTTSASVAKSINLDIAAIKKEADTKAAAVSVDSNGNAMTEDQWDEFSSSFTSKSDSDTVDAVDYEASAGSFCGC